jgi:ribonuclease D
MDKHLDKSKQLHNWYKRPLGLDVQKYAVEDVIYLLPLRAILEKELQAKNRFTWWQEELQHPKPANPPRFPPPPDPTTAAVATEPDTLPEAASTEEAAETTAFVSRVSRRVSDARKEKLQAIKKHIGETQDLAIASLCLNGTSIKLLAYGYMHWADYYLPYRLALIRDAAQTLGLDISDLE